MDWDDDLAFEVDSILRYVAEALESVTDDTGPVRQVHIGHHPYVSQRSKSYEAVCRRLGRKDSPELTRMIKASDGKPYQMNLYGSTRSSLIAIFDCRRHARGMASWEFVQGYILVVPGGAFKPKFFGNSDRLTPRFNLYQVLGPPQTWNMPMEMEQPRPTKLGQADREFARELYGLTDDRDPHGLPDTSRTGLGEDEDY